MHKQDQHACTLQCRPRLWNIHANDLLNDLIAALMMQDTLLIYTCSLTQLLLLLLLWRPLLTLLH
jgi:hypothetical protein